MITTLVKTEPALGEHRFRAVIPTRATLPQSTAPYLSLTTSTLAPTKLCPVCYQAACPLRSHKQYARYRRLEEIASARQSSSTFHTSSSVESLDSDEIFHHRLIEIGATKVDTFFDFPLPKGVKAEVHQLFQDFFILHQGRSTTGPKAGPSPLTALMREILPACSTSPALCQGIVAASAVWHGAYRGHLEPDTRTLSWYGQALQTLREALSNPSTAYSNATILAAACLTHHQVLTRNRVGLKTHVDGIQTLVNARGGLHNVAWVAHIILWIDYYTCLYVNQEPRFTWPMDNSIQLSTAPHQVYGSAFESSKLKQVLDQDLRQLCSEVSRIVELLESTTGKGSSKSVQDYYRYKRAVMGVQLGYLHARFHGQGTINECVSLTLNIVVLKVFYMHVLDESRIDLCGKLRIALECTGIGMLQDEQMDLLTWMLFAAGALAPAMSPWKGWFIDCLKKSLAAHFTRTTESSFLDMYLKGYIGKVLRSHAWSDKLLSHVFETTIGSLTLSAKKPMRDEKKMASASGLFPG